MKVSTLIWYERAARLKLAEARDDYFMAWRQRGDNLDCSPEPDRLWNIVKRRERQRNLFEWAAYRQAEDLNI